MRVLPWWMVPVMRTLPIFASAPMALMSQVSAGLIVGRRWSVPAVGGTVVVVCLACGRGGLAPPPAPAGRHPTPHRSYPPRSPSKPRNRQDEAARGGKRAGRATREKRKPGHGMKGSGHPACRPGDRPPLIYSVVLRLVPLDPAQRPAGRRRPHSAPWPGGNGWCDRSSLRSRTGPKASGRDRRCRGQSPLRPRRPAAISIRADSGSRGPQLLGHASAPVTGARRARPGLLDVSEEHRHARAPGCRPGGSGCRRPAARAPAPTEGPPVADAPRVVPLALPVAPRTSRRRS